MLLCVCEVIRCQENVLKGWFTSCCSWAFCCFRLRFENVLKIMFESSLTLIWLLLNHSLYFSATPLLSSQFKIHKCAPSWFPPANQKGSLILLPPLPTQEPITDHLCQPINLQQLHFVCSNLWCSACAEHLTSMSSLRLSLLTQLDSCSRKQIRDKRRGS